MTAVTAFDPGPMAPYMRHCRFRKSAPRGHGLPPTAIFVAKPLSADVVHEAIEEYCGSCDVR